MKRRRNLAEATVAEIRALTLDLLARREHSRLELNHKLVLRSCPEPLILQVISELASEGLQSDERFAESFVRSRMLKGQGPVKIQAELQARGVDEALIYPAINLYKGQWVQIASAALRKRFGEQKQPLEYEEQGKRMRFLQTRGFSNEQIRLVVTKQLEISD